jgi:hypothetical protein
LTSGCRAALIWAQNFVLSASWYDQGEMADFFDLALRTGRDQFKAACPFSFLVSTESLVKPAGPQRTIAPMLRDGDLIRDQPMVLPIRKVQKTFDAMITVGRTANNDLVINDVQMSKFHAYFRVGGGRITLADAGSRNGTWVAEQKLVPKGDAVLLQPGARIRFGELTFQLMDAGACWDFVRRRAKVTG